MTFAYYNEFDPKAALWLWELIDMGMIAPGIVDERSIVDVDWRDLHGFTQCHFFAGIGGWSYALRLAGIPDNTPLWTASLPCQPFSAAGKGLGKDDERHLLPHFLELVKKCKPDTIFGEQVERAIGHGWLDDLQTNMEAEGYAIGHVVLGAHSVGAAHIRQRLYWVANSASAGGCWRKSLGERRYSESRGSSEDCVSRPCDMGAAFGRMGIPNSTRPQQRIETTEAARYRRSVESAGDANGMADTKIASRERPEPRSDWKSYGGELDWMGNSERHGHDAGKIRRSTNKGETKSRVLQFEGSDPINWILCRDGKYRPIESGIKPLVDGVPRGMVHSCDPRNTQEARAMRLKGYGNAIVPQVAAEFIKAFYESIL